MRLSLKVIVFILSIFFVTIILIFSTIDENYKSTIAFENKLVKNSVKNLIDRFKISSEGLQLTLNSYNYNPDILDSLQKWKKEKIEEFFQRDNFTHLFLLNDKKQIVKGGFYDFDSKEFYNIDQKANFFKNSKNLVNKEKLYFDTFNFEKVMFDTIKIDDNKYNFKYIVIGKALNSKFLSYLSRLTNSYISIHFNHDIKNEFKIKSSKSVYSYDINRYDANTIFTYVRFKNFLSNEVFYLSMKFNRVYYSNLLKNDEVFFYIYSLLLIVFVISSYIFITKFFTKRIENITEFVKKVSKEKTLNAKISAKYDDEITYLAYKINDMLISIDSSQHEKLKKERDFLQSVIDAQKSIILITDGIAIKGTNKRFNELFHSIEYFLENIYLLESKNSKNFIDIIEKYNSYEKPAKIKINKKVYMHFIFDIKKVDSTNYIVNMNDISLINKKITTLKEKATYDELTKVYNKSTIISLGKQWFHYKDFAIIIVDIDYFKNVNDTYGHICGDFILENFVGILKSNIREFDIIGRFGGEEFIILIENLDALAIKNICNNLREKVQEHQFSYNKQTLHITASFGFSLSIQGNSFDQCFKLADEALYEAKNTGRNKVCFAPNLIY